MIAHSAKHAVVERDQLIAMELILEPSSKTRSMSVIATTYRFDTTPGTTIISGDLI
jgi:hypothetical protein